MSGYGDFRSRAVQFPQPEDPIPEYEPPSRQEPEDIDMPEPLTFPCDECDKSFPSIQALAGHKSAHGKGKVPCPTCSKLYTPGPGMARHRQTQHGTEAGDASRVRPSKSKVPCPVCKRMYRSDDLNRHKRRVHGIYAKGPQPEPEQSEPEQAEAQQWSVEDIFDTVVSLLWPDGTMPVKALTPLLVWRDATTVMMNEVSHE